MIMKSISKNNDKHNNYNKNNNHKYNNNDEINRSNIESTQQQQLNNKNKQ